jgi:chemotaxis protein MotC
MKSFAYSVASIVLGLASVSPVHAADQGHAAAPTKTEQPAAEPVEPVEPGDASLSLDQPYHLVRTLEKMQDQIAMGSSDSHGAQRQFIAEIGEKMLAADDKVWQKARNSRSAIVYVLSGGDPRVLKKLVKTEKVAGLSSNVIKGVLAYAEGSNSLALKLLAGIDPRAYDARTGGHLALAKAMAFAAEDAAMSLTLLDDARLLCPGTLVEEAALRRQVLLLASTENYPRFEMLAIDYLRRFAHSIYARNFSRSFSLAVSTSKMGEDPALMARLEYRLDELPDETRQTLYTMLAEEGIKRGRVELTRLAADKVIPLVPADSRDAMRMLLYKAAALVVTKDYDLALAGLNSVDRMQLGSNDKKLLDDALFLSVQVRLPLLVSDPITELPPLSSAAQVRHGDIPGKSQALDAARAALSQVDMLLSKEQK